MTQADQLCGWRQELIQCIQVEQAVISDVQKGKFHVPALGCKLPGHQVAVVLADGQHDAIAGRKQLARERGRDQVEPLGRVAHENDAFRRCVDEARDPLPGELVQVRRLARQRMHAAVNVGVAGAVVVIDRVEDR